MEKNFRTKIMPIIAVLAATLTVFAAYNPANSFEKSAAKNTIDSASDQSAKFDFYLLALSWSPSYCAAQGERADRTQCGLDKTYSFIVHGLWPQYEKGYPQNCPTKYGTRTSRKLENSMLDIMPSRGLIRHQWRKHGSCSGLTQESYFKKTRSAWSNISLPPEFKNLDTFKTTSVKEIKQAFVAYNPGLDENAFFVTCDKRRLREVRICMTKNLKPKNCQNIQKRSCSKTKLLMPPVRISQ